MNQEIKENKKTIPGLNKPIPILYTCKEECCGCTACYAICPKGAITMLLDQEGFYYPSRSMRRFV